MFDLVQAVRFNNKYFLLPDKKSDKCSCNTSLFGLVRCRRKAVIAVTGSGYMGVGKYCKKCWELVAHNYPELESILLALRTASRQQAKFQH